MSLAFRLFARNSTKQFVEEESKQFDVGLDFQFLRNRIDITTDYFHKTTANLLVEYTPVSGILGGSAPGSGGPTTNVGTVVNSGFEFAIGYRGNINQEFSYRINYNITALKNKTTEVKNGTNFVEGGSFAVGQPRPSRMEVGYPIGYFYGYETDGIFQTQTEVNNHPSQSALGIEAVPGDIRFVDKNGDGVINTDDKTDIGNPIPDYVMGLNITLKYKGFDFVAYAFASIGNDIVRNYERIQNPDVNRMAYSMDRWTGPGTSNKVPRLTTGTTSNIGFSDYYVEDGSYLRVQNLQLGYTIPIAISEKAKIKEARIYVGISNLITLTKYMGYDPASSSKDPIGAGIDDGFYPAARVTSVGLNLKF